MGKLNFNNAEVAFEHLSSFELRRAWILFKVIQSHLLVKVGPPIVRFCMLLHLPVLWILRLTVFRHFCGGESIEGCRKAVSNLQKRRVGAILDYSVEGANREATFDQTAAEVIRTVHHANGDPAFPFCVFKVTGLAAPELLEKYSSGAAMNDQDRVPWFAVQRRVDNICNEAANIKQRILVDAEETWLQGAIDVLAHDAMRRCNVERAIVFQTAQMYRSDRLEYLENLIGYARRQKFFVGIKLVRGAYMEKERARAERRGEHSPICASKELTDSAYNKAIEICLRNLDVVSPFIGTHNQASIEFAILKMEELGIPKNHPQIYFSQLLGMGDHLSNTLAAAGYNVAKYVPYGPVRATLPYLFRRAEENTSVAGQSGRELQLIEQELTRRAKA